MKRLALLSLLLSSLAGAQSTSIHESGGDGTSWALIRVSGGGTAHVGDINGIHIGDVTRDELIIVRYHKGYVVTDEKVLREVEAARAPVDKIREERLKVKSGARSMKLEERSAEREKRNLERSKTRLQTRESRGSDDEKKDIERQIGDLDRQQKDLDRKISEVSKQLDDENRKVDAVSKRMDEARNECLKKIEQIFDRAQRDGLAHPISG